MDRIRGFYPLDASSNLAGKTKIGVVVQMAECSVCIREVWGFETPLLHKNEVVL